MIVSRYLRMLEDPGLARLVSFQVLTSNSIQVLSDSLSRHHHLSSIEFPSLNLGNPIIDATTPSWVTIIMKQRGMLTTYRSLTTMLPLLFSSQLASRSGVAGDKEEAKSKSVLVS